MVGGVVAKLGDGLACPVGAEVGVPGRPALEDRDALASSGTLDAQLVAVLGWDLVVAVAAYCGERGVGNAWPGGHPATLERRSRTFMQCVVGRWW